jgi:hypothetical protein
MKFIAAAMLGAAMALAGPVMAQDRDKASDHDKIDTSHDRIDASQHRVTHHRVTYRRTYKSDEDEHQATEDLNRQYRGMPASGPR